MDENLGTNYNQLAQYYDLIHAELTADIEFILSLASGKKRIILELGCGTGRLALPLARAGHRVFGLDSSLEMLALAKVKLDREPADIQSSVAWIEGDMTSYHIGRLFDLVTISHNTLHELTPDTVRKVFSQIKKHLRPDGLVFIDLSNPFFALQQHDDDFFWVEDRTFIDPESGFLVHQRSTVSFDLPGQRLHIDKVLISQEGEALPGKRYTDETDLYMMYPHELVLLLESAGFQLDQLYGGYAWEPFGDDSDRMIAIARHRAK